LVSGLDHHSAEFEVLTDYVRDQEITLKKETHPNVPDTCRVWTWKS
jgi:hypothetical protein